MKAIFKKTVSIFLAFIFVFGTLVTGLAAVEAAAIDVPPTQTEGVFSYQVYGDFAFITKCNSSVNGHLTIPSKLGGYPVKWIGEGAFMECKNMTSVSFASDSQLAELYGAFGLCENLAEITLPESLEVIGIATFYGCLKLKTINITKNVYSVGGAFTYCPALKTITVDSANQYYTAEDGVLFNKDKTELIVYPAGSNRSQYSVPYGVKTIGENAFGCTVNLKTVYLPETLETIGVSAFDSSSVTTVVFPDSLKTIKESAFSNCDLANVYFRENPSLTTIEHYAFAYCYINSFHVPATVTTMQGEQIFEGSIWKEGEYICSTTADCAAKAYADECNIPFVVCNGHDIPEIPVLPDAPEESDDNENEAITIKLNGNSSDNDIKLNYNKSLSLSVDIPSDYSGYKVVWESSDNNIATVENGNVTAVYEGKVTISVYIVDADGNVVCDKNGNEISDSFQIECKMNFFQKIIAFFKNLFASIFG